MLFNACVWFICRVTCTKIVGAPWFELRKKKSSAVGFFPRSLVASQHAPVSDVLLFLSPVVAAAIAAAIAAEIRPREFP